MVQVVHVNGPGAAQHCTALSFVGYWWRGVEEPRLGQSDWWYQWVDLHTQVNVVVELSHLLDVISIVCKKERVSPW